MSHPHPRSIQKELGYYHAELEAQKLKVAGMRERAEDEYDIRKQVRAGPHNNTAVGPGAVYRWLPLPPPHAPGC